MSPEDGWVDDVPLRSVWPPSVRPTAETSFRNAVAVPESYRIDEFGDAGRMRRSPEPAGSPFLNRWVVDAFHALTSFETRYAHQRRHMLAYRYLNSSVDLRLRVRSRSLFQLG
jgi:hypothetical protein